MERARRPWHRDDLPAWGWVALVALRLVTLAWTLLPVVLLGAGLWWWTHGGSRQAPRLAKQAVEYVRAAVDSLVGR